MRLALGVSYLGRAYSGWQSQVGVPTVQDRLEQALSQFADTRIQVICAGRTDAGVHAMMQVVHTDSPVERSAHAWVRGTNCFLPDDIAVQWAQEVPERFHARFSATGRRYVYCLLESAVRPSLEAGRVGWVFRPLDGEAMRAAANHLVGEHDFTSFRASQCQSPTPVKHLRQLHIARRGPYWQFSFEANAFLHHMIRNIMGCLVQIGQSRHPPDWILEVMHARDRDAAAPTFSADGLYFLGPLYDAHWGLPERVPAYDWLP